MKRRAQYQPPRAAAAGLPRTADHGTRRKSRRLRLGGGSLALPPGDRAPLPGARCSPTCRDCHEYVLLVSVHAESVTASNQRLPAHQRRASVVPPSELLEIGSAVVSSCRVQCVLCYARWCRHLPRQAHSSIPIPYRPRASYRLSRHFGCRTDRACANSRGSELRRDIVTQLGHQPTKHVLSSTGRYKRAPGLNKTESEGGH